LKDAKWSYLAGLIDGEGHIGITKGCRYWRNKDGVETKYPAYSLQISVANNSSSLMTFLIKHFGGVYYTHTRINPNARDGYTWQPKGAKNKEALLLAVLPYLVIKTAQAKMALEFLRMRDEINPEKRETFHAMSLRLNQRGVSPTTNMPDDLPYCQPAHGPTVPANLKIESDLMGDHESAPVVTQAA
jgi:hypothetical protein